MAFTNRLGNLFKQTVNSNHSSVFRAIRCMSSSKLFIGGLSFGTDDQSLREAFTSFGEVVEARVISDRETGRSRGFGFVSFTSGEEASAAISAMDGKIEFDESGSKPHVLGEMDLHGRVVRVNYATDRTGGFGGGSGGYRGGGGGYNGDSGGYGGYNNNYNSGSNFGRSSGGSIGNGQEDGLLEDDFNADDEHANKQG